MSEHVISAILGNRWRHRLFAPETGGAAGGEAGGAGAEGSAAEGKETGGAAEAKTQDAQTQGNEGKTSDDGATTPPKQAGEGTALGGGEPAKTAEETETKGDEAEKQGDTKEDDALEQVPDDGNYEVYGELPENLVVSDEDKAFWNEQFKGLGLTTGQAQQVVALAVADRERQAASVMSMIEAQQQEHSKLAHADKEIGGDNWNATVALANRALTALRGGERQTFDKDGKPTGGQPPGAIEQMLLATGNGNNPEVLRELRRLGELFKDDSFAAGRPLEAPASAENRWYADTTPDKKRG